MLFVRRVRKAHFGPVETLISWAGLPLFAYLLLRSRIHYKWRRQVEWKDRIYRAGAQPSPDRERQEVVTAKRP